MNEINDLYKAGFVIEDTLTLLEQALSALTVTMEALEEEGIQPEGKMNEGLALNFVKRFPMYYQTLALIRRDMCTTYDSLQASADSIFEAHKKQREGQAR